MATAVAEAEAGIHPSYNQYIEKVMKLQIDIQTLPKSKPEVQISATRDISSIKCNDK